MKEAMKLGYLCWTRFDNLRELNVCISYFSIVKRGALRNRGDIYVKSCLTLLN